MTASLVIDKLRKILKARGLSVFDIFDGRRLTNVIEFKNKIKPLGLLGREIDMMYEAISACDESGAVDLALL